MRFPVVSAAIVTAALLAACNGGPIDSGPKDDVTISVSDSSLRLDEDGSIAVLLQAELVDGEGELTYEIVSQPARGQLVGTNNQWEYVPARDANGQDSFTWVARVGEVESEVATVTIYIDAVNDAPTASNSLLGTDEDTPVDTHLNAVDIEGDELTWTVVAAPEHGSLDLDAATGDAVYTPDPDFAGDDSFLWAAQDPSGGTTGPTRVDITVGEANDPPVVEPALFVLFEDSSLQELLTADDPEGDDLSWRIEVGAAHGVLELDTNNGTFSYTPWPNYFGPDSFTVVASDGFQDSDPVQIELVVTGINDAPVAPPALLEIDEDTVLSTTLSAADAEQDPISFTIDSAATQGRLTLNPLTGDLTYTPDPNWFGIDEFTVVASDGASSSLPGRVTVVVRAVNDPPLATGSTLLLTNEDVAVPGSVEGADPEGDTLTYEVVTPPEHGTLTLSASSGDYVYAPSPDYNGLDAFSIKTFDGTDSSVPAEVTVQVLPVNDAPRLTPVSLTVVEDTPGTITLPATDPEGDLLYFLVQGEPPHGSASLDSLTGELTYTPDLNYIGPDVVLYTVTDGKDSSNGILLIDVARDNDGDSVPDTIDNCPQAANLAQSDVNSNGVGDACDCWTEPFSVTLDDGRWASHQLTQVVGDAISPSHAVALQGDGAYLQTTGQPGLCAAFEWSVAVRLGTPPPEDTDALVISARSDGGPWVQVGAIFGTGSTGAYQSLSGSTDGLGLDGEVIEWRLEVVGNEEDDVFTIDDFSVACDTDADTLEDCLESTLEGFDLTSADADGDGWLDGDELLAGTDPNDPDTDFDAIDDPIDNCPTAFNPTQADGDGNGDGDACDLSFQDDFASGTIDPVTWASVSGEALVVSSYSYSDAYSFNLSGNGLLEARPIDFNHCSLVSWDFRIKLGPSTPLTTERVILEAWNGTDWTTLAEVPGTGSTSTDFTPRVGSTTNANVLKQGARLRFRNTSTSTAADFFLDDVVVGCDSDGDKIPNYKEFRYYGTDSSNPDTDGDGVEDGAEILAGTNPLAF